MNTVQTTSSTQMTVEYKLDRSGLTDRQRSVVYLINEGLSNREIGVRLGIAERTVKAHTDTIRHRHGIGSRRLIVPTLRHRGLI